VRITEREDDVESKQKTSEAITEAMTKIENDLRAEFGDKFVDHAKNLAQQRDAFKSDLINAIEGKSGREMAAFLNDRAWLWKYLYEDAERDPEFMFNLGFALGKCSESGDVPEHWHRAVKEAKENHTATMALRQRFP
jgi:hypothetical protein